MGGNLAEARCLACSVHVTSLDQDGEAAVTGRSVDFDLSMTISLTIISDFVSCNNWVSPFSISPEELRSRSFPIQTPFSSLMQYLTESFLESLFAFRGVRTTIYLSLPCCLIVTEAAVLLQRRDGRAQAEV